MKNFFIYTLNTGQENIFDHLAFGIFISSSGSTMSSKNPEPDVADGPGWIVNESHFSSIFVAQAKHQVKSV